MQHAAMKALAREREERNRSRRVLAACYFSGSSSCFHFLSLSLSLRQSEWWKGQVTGENQRPATRETGPSKCTRYKAAGCGRGRGKTESMLEWERSHLPSIFFSLANLVKKLILPTVRQKMRIPAAFSLSLIPILRPDARAKGERKRGRAALRQRNVQFHKTIPVSCSRAPFVPHTHTFSLSPRLPQEAQMPLKSCCRDA